MTLTLPQTAFFTERVHVQSGPFRLEGELLYSEQTPRGGIVLANPHPLLGGHIGNNVIRGLGDGLAGRGWIVLRFNYRGVGASEGPAADVASSLAEFVRTSHLPEEMDLRFDLEAAIDYVAGTVGPETPISAVGYSFGCALLARVERIKDLASLVLIGPTLGRHDYTPFEKFTAPKLVIASEDDFATDPAELRRWFAALPAPKRLILERRDNHFFRGHEPWLADVSAEFLSSAQDEGR